MAVSLHPSTQEIVSNSRLLVVGAGGIGCELIKNLVLTGFNNLVIVDLDTIDVSNLNRQFLFQKCHVGRPKVEVARESALLFNPQANITAIHDSILSAEYNVTFFKQFSLVMNALDNKTARSHVNRLCLAAGVTLIESGTAGYLGQVTVIRKGVTECYECQPKPSAKTFPGCTIRNTPSEPIHCIVWAKHLFSQLFGAPDADNDVSPDTDLLPPDGDEENNKMEEEKNEIRQQGKAISTREWAEKIEYDPERLFEKLFCSDINYLLTMEKLWQSRRPPTPLTLDQLPQDAEDNQTVLPDQRQWSVKKCAETFLSCITQLRGLYCSLGELAWDKDDTDSLDFVVAAANLRAFAFNIPRKSRFDIKSMAGNIVPAIATTNAVIAGLIVMEGLKVLAGEFTRCKTTYLPRQPNPRKRLLVTCSLFPPNPSCYVCSPRPEACVKLNCTTLTVLALKEKILIGRFGMVAPDVEIDDGKGTILLSSDEGDTDDNLPRSLSEFGIVDGSRLKVDDFLQNYQLVINILHSDQPLGDDKEFLVLASDQEKEDEDKEEEEEVGQSRKRRAHDKPESSDTPKKQRLEPAT